MRHHVPADAGRALFVGALFAAVCLLPRDAVRGEDAPAPEHPAFVFRTIDLPATDPQLSNKLGEYFGEKWELVAPYATGSAVLRRPYREFKDLSDAEKKLLASLKGQWALSTLQVYGVQKWPTKKGATDGGGVNPVAGGANAPATTKPAPGPVTLSFDGARYCITQEAAADGPAGPGPKVEKKAQGPCGKGTVIHQGTVQYVAGSADKGFRIDFLIEDDGSDKRWFTVRAVGQVSAGEKDAKQRNFELCSGGLTPDRPDINLLGAKTGTAGIPAKSVWASKGNGD